MSVVAHPAISDAVASLAWHIYATEGRLTMRVVYAGEAKARERAVRLAGLGMRVSLWHNGELVEHYRG